MFISFYTGMYSIWILTTLKIHPNLPAFEFTKRRFQVTYGPQLPVWALLTSGATGGVSSYHLWHFHYGLI